MKIRRLSDNESSATPAESMSAVQAVLLLVMLAGLFVFVLVGAMAWMGLEVETIACASMGVALTATGLSFIGAAILPSWERTWWKPAPGGQATVRLGRLSSLGAGIWFAGGGLAFLGKGWLTEYLGLWVLVPFAAGFAIIMVGMQFDRRRAEAAWAVLRRRGWLAATLRDDADRPDVEAQQLQAARDEMRRSIMRQMIGRITLEQANTQHPHLADAGLAEEWRAFRSAFAEDDQIWAFKTVSAQLGVAQGEEGFARVRQGAVVDWFITAVVG